MDSPDRSSGKPIQIRSLLRESVGPKCWDQSTSALNHLDCRTQALEFYSGTFGREPPVHGHSERISVALPDADLVFLGLRTPEEGAESEYATRLEELVSGFRSAVLVRNAGPFAGDLI